jgi:hypothetical protein
MLGIVPTKRCSACGEVFSTLVPLRHFCASCRSERRLDEYVEVYPAGTPEEAVGWQGLLGGQRIPTRLRFASRDNDEGGRDDPGLKAYLMVRKRDAERALELLEARARRQAIASADVDGIRG